jgi:tryptophanyl-tRNA synthetase
MPGLDGQKMSKSYNNTISLREAPEDVAKKLKAMPTDPARIRRTDAGNPKNCPVWQLHEVYSDDAKKQWVMEGCTSAGIGCIDCKNAVAEGINVVLAPMRARAAELAAEPEKIDRILRDGAERARVLANETMSRVRAVMGLTG